MMNMNRSADAAPSPARLSARRLNTVAAYFSLLASVACGASTPDGLGYVAQQGEEWAPYSHKLDIVPGSVFDFSEILETPAPAGRFGPIMVNADGHMAFRDRPDVPVRFWGANLVYSANYPKKEVMDRVAERFARQGYNTVRFHHYDRNLIQPGGFSYELNPEKLDQLDYFFAAFKKRGVYINIDLFSDRSFKAAECPEYGKDFRQEIKALMPLYDSAFDAWKKYAEALLNHVNPYTGLKWGEDPALIGICPVNEDPLPGEIWRNRDVAQHWVAMHKEWKKSLPEAQQNSPIDSSFDRFVYLKQVETYQKAMAVIRATGAAGLGTGLQYQVLRVSQMVRAHQDVVDVHSYWDDVKIPPKQWVDPLISPQSSYLLTGKLTWQRANAGRIIGKPMILTELNFVYPSRYRCEGPAINAADACMQDWDAAYQFDYSAHFGPLENGGSGGYFYSIATDPIATTGDRLTALMFRRGDFKVADRAIAYLIDDQPALTPNRVYEGLPDALYQLGKICRVGSVVIAGDGKLTPDMIKRYHIVAAVAESPVSADKSGGLPVYLTGNDLIQRLEDNQVIPKGSIDVSRKHFASTTGQIVSDGEAGVFKAVSDRSECYVLNANVSARGSFASIDNGKAFSSFMFTSADNKPLAQSKRILAVHLTDSLNTGSGFIDADRTKWVVRGGLPYLIYKSDATVALKINPGEKIEIWTLAPDGARVARVPFETTADGISLKFSTSTNTGATLAYEIIRP